MKYCPPAPPGVALRSPPSRGAWIEMVLLLLLLAVSKVAPLAGGVD